MIKKRVSFKKRNVIKKNKFLSKKEKRDLKKQVSFQEKKRD